MMKRISGLLAKDEDQTFFSTDPDPAQLEKNPDPDTTPDPTLNRNEEKNISIF